MSKTKTAGDATPKVKVTGAWATLQEALELVPRIYIYGPPGIGKSFTAYQALCKFNADNDPQTTTDVLQVTFDEDSAVQEYMGHFVPEGSRFVWHHGPIARGLTNGSLILNEIPLASASVRDMLLRVLDNPETARVTLPNGEVIRPHSRFRVIATGNTSPEEAAMSEALVDRFDLVINITEPHPQIVHLLNAAIQGLGKIVKDSYKDVARLISARKAQSFVALAQSMTEERAAKLVFGVRADDVLLALKVHRSTLTDTKTESNTVSDKDAG